MAPAAAPRSALRWQSLRQAGATEASASVSACPRLPQASASLCRSTARSCADPPRRPASRLTAAPSRHLRREASCPACWPAPAPAPPGCSKVTEWATLGGERRCCNCSSASMGQALSSWAARAALSTRVGFWSGGWPGDERTFLPQVSTASASVVSMAFNGDRTKEIDGEGGGDGTLGMSK